MGQKYLNWALTVRMGFYGVPPIYYSIGATRAGGSAAVDGKTQEVSATNLRKAAERRVDDTEENYVQRVTQFLPSALSDEERTQVIGLIKGAHPVMLEAVPPLEESQHGEIDNRRFGLTTCQQTLQCVKFGLGRAM